MWKVITREHILIFILHCFLCYQQQTKTKQTLLESSSIKLACCKDFSFSHEKAAWASYITIKNVILSARLNSALSAIQKLIKKSVVSQEYSVDQDGNEGELCCKMKGEKLFRMSFKHIHHEVNLKPDRPLVLITSVLRKSQKTKFPIFYPFASKNCEQWKIVNMRVFKRWYDSCTHRAKMYRVRTPTRKRQAQMTKWNESRAFILCRFLRSRS